jgi:hypothetical protein
MSDATNVQPSRVRHVTPQNRAGGGGEDLQGSREQSFEKFRLDFRHHNCAPRVRHTTNITRIYILDNTYILSPFAHTSHTHPQPCRCQICPSRSPSTTPMPTQNGSSSPIAQSQTHLLILILRNDILRKHGVIPEKPPSPTPMIQEALEQARHLAHENRLEGKDLDELDALEDEEDDDFLESYRQKRMAEMASTTAASVYNQVYHIQKPDYSRDVTEASKTAWVLVLLTSSSGTNTESRILIEIWRELAQRFGDVKFCQMRADLCIEGYPDRNTPTVLVYWEGDIKRQIVTLGEFGGVRTGSKGIFCFHLGISLGVAVEQLWRLPTEELMLTFPQISKNS